MATFQAGSVIENITSTATAGGTTTLDIESDTYQRFTGTMAQTVVLPDATTLPNAKRFYIANRSTQTVTVQYDSTTLAAEIEADTERLFVLADNSTSDGTWDVSTGTGGGGGGGGSTPTVLTDWIDYSGSVTIPAWAGTAVTADTEYWGKRVGDTLVARGAFQIGTPTGANSTFFLPAGLTLDSSKFTQATVDPTRDARHLVGTGNALLNTGTVIDNGTTLAIFYDKETDGLYITNSTDPGGTREFWIRAANGYLNADEVITFEVQVPILEWANSSVNGAQPMTASYEYSAPTSVPDATDFVVVPDTLIFDNTGGEYDSGTGVLTAVQDATWQVNCSASFDASATGVRSLFIRKNGTIVFAPDFKDGASAAGDLYLNTSFAVDLLIGDTLEVVVNQNSGGALNLDSAQVSYVRVNRDVDLLTKVAARYTQDSAQSIPTSTITIVDFEDMDFDTHNLVTTGAAWKFTAQSNGYYAILARVTYSTLSNVNNYNIYIYKNGSLTTRGYAGGDASLIVCDLLQLNAGDYVDIRTDQDTGGSVVLDAAGSGNGVSIWEIGPSGVDTNTEPVKVIVENNYNQALTGGVDTVLGFDVEVVDSHNAMNIVTGVFTVPFAGQYAFNVSLGFTQQVTLTSGYMFVQRNGSATKLGSVQFCPANSNLWFSWGGMLQLDAGDTIEFIANPNVTTTVDTTFLGGSTVSIFRVV